VPRDVALVTGGNSGIGFEAARALARAGWHVLLASRSRAASAAAVARIEGESGPGSASELGLDLASLASVRQLAKEVEARDLPLRALVCNAGLQGRELQRSADGYERTFAANHLGHFLLVNRLLPRLAARAPARIVVVASGVHDPAQRTGMPKPAISDFDALAAGEDATGAFSGPRAYVHSKLCNVWFTYELARRLAASGLSTSERPLTANAYDPGLVPGSGLARDYPPALRFVWDRVLPGVARALTPVYPGISTAPKSGEALARLVLDPALARTTGRYFPSTARWREAPSSAESYDESRARALWEASARLCALAPAESPLARTSP
jgi:NAD(P)-dependent dehydrogenase (short-subunit alcohol dehydrogenase family)